MLLFQGWYMHLQSYAYHVRYRTIMYNIVRSFTNRTLIKCFAVSAYSFSAVNDWTHPGNLQFYRQFTAKYFLDVQNIAHRSVQKIFEISIISLKRRQDIFKESSTFYLKFLFFKRKRSKACQSSKKLRGRVYLQHCNYSNLLIIKFTIINK